MESFRVQCFVPPFLEAFKDSRLDKSWSTFYESLKKYDAKIIKKVIDLLSEYFNIIHMQRSHWHFRKNMHEKMPKNAEKNAK